MATSLTILHALKECWRRRLSGALFMKLDNGHLMQLYLLQGELQSIRYRNYSGMDAIKLIPTLALAKSKFHGDVVVEPSKQLPPTQHIISMLDTGNISSAAVVGVEHIREEHKYNIEEVLVDYVGPIARLLIEETWQEALALSDFVKMLSLELDDDKQRHDFYKRAMACIN